MKFIRVFLLAAFLILVTGCAAAAVPAYDGNHFYQQITLTSDTAVGNATVHFFMPFPLRYDNADNSYRFYDDDGNALDFSYFNKTANAASITLNMDLAAGENIIWVTGGNKTLGSVSNTSVYGYYMPPTNIATGTYTYNVPAYNFAEYSSSNQYGSYNTMTNVSFQNSSTGSFQNMSVNNSTGNWYWNGTSYTSLFSGLGANESHALYAAMDGSNVTFSINHTSGTQYHYLTEISNESAQFTGNRIVLNLSYTASHFDNASIAASMITPVNVTCGEVYFYQNSPGLYIQFVDSVNGNILRLGDRTNSPSSISGGVTAGQISTNGTTPSIFHVYAANVSNFYSFMTSNATFNQSGTSTNYSMVGSGRNAVIYIPDFKYDTQFILTTPSTLTAAYTGYNSSSYSLQIPGESRLKIIQIPIVRETSNATTSIWGVVADEFGRPVSGADIEIFGANGTLLRSLQSQQGGLFGAAGLVNDTYYLRFSADGYGTMSGYLVSPTKQVIQMQKLHNITIHVVDDAGNPVKSFTTFLGQNQSIKSTDNGTVVYNNWPSGETEVIIQAAGFYQVTKSIFISDQNTEFTLTILRDSGQEYVTPHYVRLFYRTLLGAPVSGLNIDVYRQNSTDPDKSGITGSDGSVSFRLDETVKYRFVARLGTDIVHEFSTYPTSNEYVIFLGNANQTDPSTVLSRLLYSITSENINETHANIFVNMTTNESNEIVDYLINVYREDGVTVTNSGNFTREQSVPIVVEINHTYIVSVTFTDAAGKSMAVSKTIRFYADETKAKFKLPGFTEQWHYNSLCVFIILVTAFLFSEKTKHIGLVVIPLEFMFLLSVGWLTMSVLAISLCIAAIIAAIVIALERVDRE